MSIFELTVLSSMDNANIPSFPDITGVTDCISYTIYPVKGKRVTVHLLYTFHSSGVWHHTVREQDQCNYY